ncbi:hypothetical protein [Teredinibacter turnerae]|uniref:hypothetical protein n=1 Tax=Teredinibacter turnerae TaxID=2426 RepID=UPI00041CD4F1|nr:hypothetical protein [Teredinibacter turnerae]
MKVEDITLADLIIQFRRDKYIVLSILLFTVLCFLLFSYYLPEEFESEAVLMPSEDILSSAGAQVGAPLGGLASLAGLSFPTNAKTGLALEILRSRKFILEFVELNKLEVELMAVSGWDAGSQRLIVDQGIYDSKKGEWVNGEPLKRDLYIRFQKLFSVSQTEDNFIILRMRYYSGELAKKWLYMVISAINEEIRVRDFSNASKKIEFLREKESVVQKSEAKAVFYKLLEEQIKQAMVAEVADEYVFTIIDPPFLPEKKIYPKRALFAVGGLLAGFLICLLYSLVRLLRLEYK